MSFIPYIIHHWMCLVSRWGESTVESVDSVEIRSVASGVDENLQHRLSSSTKLRRSRRQGCEGERGAGEPLRAAAMPYNSICSLTSGREPRSDVDLAVRMRSRGVWIRKLGEEAAADAMVVR